MVHDILEEGRFGIGFAGGLFGAPGLGVWGVYVAYC